MGLGSNYLGERKAILVKRREKPIRRQARRHQLGQLGRAALRPPMRIGLRPGHRTAQQWLELLFQSKFLIGLGNPLLGPSAIEAVSLGCMFINPVYSEPKLSGRYSSQHPYLARLLKEKQLDRYICEYAEQSVDELEKCIRKALATALPAKKITEFTREVHFARVKEIFQL